MKVAEVMTAPIHSVTSDKSVQYASNMMANYRIGSLIVMDAGQVSGILTSRDIRAAHPNRIVADAMTPDPISVSSDVFAWEALKLMESRAIERLVVMDGETPSGIVTREAIISRLAEWRDSLTHMYRSPYIHAIGEHLLRRRISFHLLFLDLNHFGEVNKRFGHPVGDDLIRGYADKLRSLLGDEDHLCRYAGDEFAIITSRTDSDVAELVSELSEPIIVGPASLSASVGWVNDRRDPDFYRLSFKELISKASLMSTELKPA